MLSKLIQFALMQRFLFVVFAAVIVGGGVYAWKELPIDAFPDISNTQVQVIVKASGMTPTEVEQRITRPLEIEVRGIPKQTVLRSITKYALCVITIDFADGTDMYWARQQVSERITQVLSGLPEGVEGGLAPITMPLSDIYMFLVEGEDYTNMELRSVLDWIIRPRLLSVEGVADVNALGGEVRSFHVIPRPEALQAYELDIDDLSKALKNNNANAGGDRFVRNDEVLLVTTIGQLKTLEDIAAISVAVRDQRPILISDVADVKLGALTRYGAVTAHGKGEAVEGLVLNRRGANGRKTVEAVKAALEDIKTALPEGVSIVPFYDRSELITASVATVRNALIQAVVLVLIVLILFLGNLRSAISVGIILPLTVLGTFVAMYFSGLTANLMSLGGIAIAVGILVDSAVVMVENIHSQLHHDHKHEKAQVVLHAAKEVAPPIFAGVLIIAISLFPILALTGIEGKLFRPLAQTIGISILVSLVLSLTIIPVFASLLMKPSKQQDNIVVRFLQNTYRPLLNLVMRNRKSAIIGGTVIVLLSLLLGTRIGSEFLPFLDEGTMLVQFEKLPTISLERSIQIDNQIEQKLLELPEITGIVSRLGSDELRLDPMGLNESDVFLVTKPRHEWESGGVEGLQTKIRAILDTFPGILYGFTQPIDMRVSEMISGVTSAVAIKLSGDDLATLDQKAKEIEALVNTVEGAIDVQRTPLEGQLYLNISMRHAEAARLGITVQQVNQLVSQAVGGRVVTEVIEGNKRIPVLVRYPSLQRSSAAAIGNLRLSSADGHPVYLSDITKITEVDGPTQIDREDGNRLVVLESNMQNRDVVGFVNELRQLIEEKIDLPPGYFIEYGGQFENQARASARLQVVVPVSLFVIFIILFLTFGAIRQALLILLNIPFALVGGILTLYFSGFYLSVPASIGFVALIGLAIMNGVVMVNHFNQLREIDGLDIDKATFTGACNRLRPVLMTAILTVLGLVPLLLATGPGSEIQKPLAVVVIGGTVSSTLLTLLLLPALYSGVEAIVAKRHEEKTTRR
ncbi:MAG: CusA/CzcA family heavy metal efflux RND transporter [Verrucomicrobiales bacterium]|nr:CusA/CzcA family heavy metal efflux RND transporter [Verrucomicrobiales bacterium]